MWPAHGAYCGDIDLTGWRKPVSHYRQPLWNEQEGSTLPCASLTAISDSISRLGCGASILYGIAGRGPDVEGKEIQVEVYSRFPSVRLYLNDRFIGEKPTTRQEQF